MGADFLYNYIPICKLTPKRLAALAAEVSDVDYLDPDLLNKGIPLTEEVLKNAINDYTSGRWALSREVSVMSMPHADFYITGGMSWGDPPTDAYDDFKLLSDVEDLLLKWAIEDKSKRRKSSRRKSKRVR